MKPITVYTDSRFLRVHASNVQVINHAPLCGEYGVWNVICDCAYPDRSKKNCQPRTFISRAQELSRSKNDYDEEALPKMRKKEYETEVCIPGNWSEEGKAVLPNCLYRGELAWDREQEVIGFLVQLGPYAYIVPLNDLANISLDPQVQRATVSLPVVQVSSASVWRAYLLEDEDEEKDK